MKFFKVFSIIAIIILCIAFGSFVYMYSLTVAPRKKTEVTCSSAVVGEDYFKFENEIFDKYGRQRRPPDALGMNDEYIYMYTDITIGNSMPICLIYVKDNVIIKKELINSIGAAKVKKWLPPPR